MMQCSVDHLDKLRIGADVILLQKHLRPYETFMRMAFKAQAWRRVNPTSMG